MSIEQKTSFSIDPQSLPSQWWINKDEVLARWYEQESTNIPENQRVVLSLDQQEIVDFNKELDVKLEKLKEEESYKPHKEFFGPGVNILIATYFRINPQLAEEDR